MYIQFNRILGGAATVTVGASQTNSPVSDEFNVTENDSLYFRYQLDISAITVAAAITAKLQHSFDGGATWDDVGAGANATPTTTGRTTVALNPVNNPTLLPLKPRCRIVVTTGAGDTVTVTAVRITNRPAN